MKENCLFLSPSIVFHRHFQTHFPGVGKHHSEEINIIPEIGDYIAECDKKWLKFRWKYNLIDNSAFNELRIKIIFLMLWLFACGK